MKNITQSVKGDVLTLTIDLKALQGPSASGKSVVIATTEGNVPVDGHPEIKLGVNCYTAKK
jgi:hypothetical protein